MLQVYIKGIAPAYAGSAGAEPPKRYLSFLRFLFSRSGSFVFAFNFALLAKLVSTHRGMSVPLSTNFEIIFSTTVLPSTDIELKRLLSRRSQFPNDVVPEHKKLLQKLQCLNVLNTHPLFSDLDHSCQYISTKTVNWSQFNWTTFNWSPPYLSGIFPQKNMNNTKNTLRVNFWIENALHRPR